MDLFGKKKTVADIEQDIKMVTKEEEYWQALAKRNAAKKIAMEAR